MMTGSQQMHMFCSAARPHMTKRCSYPSRSKHGRSECVEVKTSLCLGQCSCQDWARWMSGNGAHQMAWRALQGRRGGGGGASMSQNRPWRVSCLIACSLQDIEVFHNVPLLCYKSKVCYHRATHLQLRV